jgi:hypothetical protein
MNREELQARQETQDQSFNRRDAERIQDNHSAAEAFRKDSTDSTKEGHERDSA